MTNPFKACSALASLCAAILLGGCVWQSDYDALQTKNKDLGQQLATQQAENGADKVQIARLQGAIKYTVDSDLLFAPGSWQMRAAGQETIAKLAKKLASTQQNKLVVNGYTDNAPIGPGLVAQGVTSNQELSQKRGESVMQFLVSRGMKSDLISAHGYGEAEPVASNDTARGRAQNRRVEITLAAATM
jgi:chemotaxis protein MotB